MKKTWLVRTILAALLSCGMVFALASCSTNYTVSYSLGEHAADGAAAPESAEYEQGTQITLPEAPAAEDGWEFTAWSDGETTYDAGDGYTVEANVTFTAQWTEVTTPEPETYTVTYAVGANAADGAAAPAAVQVEDGESVTLPAGDGIPAAATGYHFDGWYVEGTKIEGTTYTPAADVTITATYAANIYTVAFDDNVDDSSVTGTMASQPFTYGTAQNLTDNAFTRTGYTFSGWATSADGTVAYDDEGSVNNLTAENGATVTLYAVWDPIAPTIEWVKTDNVTGSDPSGTIYSWNEENGNYTITLPENTYSCAGSVFNGWFVVVSESSNSYQPDETFTVAPGTKVTISPAWKVTSTITFDPNGAAGGTVPAAIKGKVSGDTIDLPGNTGNLVRTGYTFGGWSETKDGNAIGGQYTVEGNVTLYAVWTANTYTVTLDYNYENAPADVTITVTFGSTFGAGDGWPTADPVRDGFTFMGWWTANDGTGTQYTGATQVTTEAANLTLYAHWSATAVSVTFDYNDGTDSTEHDQIVPVEVNGTITAEDVNDPTREGYRFDGWYTDATNGTKVEFPIGNVTEPATYYAHWTQVWTVSVDGVPIEGEFATGETYMLPDPDAREGYTFMGWTDGTSTTSNATGSMGTENIVLETVWANHSAIKTEAELLAVLADAAADEITLADNIDMTTSGIDIRRDISIDLNGKTIMFITSATAAAADRIRLTAYGTSYNDRIEVTITNGALGFNTNGNTNIDESASMIFTQNVDLTMDGVAVTSDAMGLFIACGKLNMTNCTVTAVGAYAIGTNASISEGSELYGPVDMTILGSTLTAEFNGGAGLLFNVAGSLTLTNTSVTGGRQGVIIRSGTATITGGSITSAWTDPDTDSYIDSWGSGTAVPMAALVIGDISANAYKNNTSVTISGTQVIVKGDPVPSAARYIYIAGDATDGTTATLTYACDDTYMSALADTNGIIVANNSASVVVKHSETLTYVKEQEATCTEDGTKEHYKCETCGALFILQDEVYVEVEEADLVIEAAGSHIYGTPVLATDGENVGKFVATCSNCGDVQVVAQANSTLTVAFADDRTGYALDEEILASDFVVTVTYTYTQAWNDASVDDIFTTITLTSEEYASYFTNNLSDLSAEAWAEGLVATFTFTVGETKVAEGSLTFDVIPTSAQLGIGDAVILESINGDATNKHIDLNVLQNVESTGVSVSFWLNEETTNDWAAVINNSGLIVTLPNLDPWNNDSPQAEDLHGINRTPLATHFRNGATYFTVFLNSICYVTVTLNVDGTVDYYKNGILVLSYGGTETMGDNTTLISTFTQRLLNFMTTSGFDFAGGVSAADLFVTTALDATAAASVYSWYRQNYLADTLAMEQAVGTALGETVDIYAAYADTANASVISADMLNGVETKGLAVTFWIDGALSPDNDFSIVVKSGEYYVRAGILSNYTTGDFGNSVFPGDAGVELGEAATELPYQTFLSGNCWVTISLNTDGSLSYYKDGKLAFTYGANLNMPSNGTGKVGDNVKAMLECIAENGMTVGGRFALATGTIKENYTWIDNLVVTSALSGEQPTTIWNTLRVL